MQYLKLLNGLLNKILKMKEIIIKSDAIPNIQCYNEIKNMNYYESMQYAF